MASTSRPGVTTTAFGPLQIAISVLTVATAVIHLVWGMRMGFRLSMFPLVFYLNFLGYIVLLAGLYLPQTLAYHRPIRWVLIGYTLLTIVLYFVMTGGRFNPVAYIDKAIEAVLVVLLFIEHRNDRT